MWNIGLYCVIVLHAEDDMFVFLLTGMVPKEMQ